MSDHNCHSDLLADIHEDIQSLHRLDIVDKITMRSFDELCLMPIKPMIRQEIHGLHDHEHATRLHSPTPHHLGR